MKGGVLDFVSVLTFVSCGKLYLSLLRLKKRRNYENGNVILKAAIVRQKSSQCKPRLELNYSTDLTVLDKPMVDDGYQSFD